MAEIARLQVVVGAQISDFNKKIGEVQKNIRSKLGDAGWKGSKGAVGVLTGVTTALGGLGIAAIKAAADMEQTRIAFTTLLKDGAKAKQFLGELERFAASTPFELPGVLDASKRLLAFGFSAQQVIPILTAVGDSAAALGLGEAGIQRLTLAIGQMQAKGKVSAEEMLQLAEAGVPAWDMLAQKIGVDIPTAMKMASQSQISAADGIQAVISGMNSKFGGMMAQQAQTVNGIMSNIRDSVGQTMVVIGDDLTEGFDLKSSLSEAQEAINSFAQAVKSNGLQNALREFIPSTAVATIGAFGGALTFAAIPAITVMTLSLFKMGLAAAAAIGPIGLAAAAIGAAGALIWQNWDYVAAEWEYGWAVMDLTVNETTGSIQSSIADMVSTAADGINSVMALMGQSSEIANNAKAWAADIQKASEAAIKAAMENKDAAAQRVGSISLDVSIPKVNKWQNADVNNLGLGGNSPTGMTVGGGAKGLGIDKIGREIDRINEQLANAQQKTLDMQADFNSFNMELTVSGLDAFEQVYANIVKERDERIAAVNEWQARFTTATQEAQQLYERAMATGDQNVINNAMAMLAQRKSAEIEAARESANMQKAINAEMNDQLLSQATVLAATKAELDDIQREGDLERYIAYLDEEKAAFLQNQTEQQEMMQQYYNWRLEAESSYASFAMDAANTLKNGLAQGFANAIVEGGSLTKTLQNLGKEIVKMFIQWQVNRMASAALTKMLMAQETAAVAAQGAAMATALAPAAWLKLVVSPGAAGTATSLLTAGLSGAISASVAGNAATSLENSGAVARSKVEGYTQEWKPLAAGGVVSAPTHALIGEKNYPEAVLPLRSSVLEKITSFLFDGIEIGANGNVTVEVNNYGDINNDTDYDAFMNDMEYAVAMGMRG